MEFSEGIMRLKRLLKDVPLTVYSGNKEIEITGITENSKLVAPGNLFIAKKGHLDDGSKYIEEAVKSGAVAILTTMGDPFLKNVVQLVHPNISEVVGKLAAAFYGNPSKELFVIGVTGTNGKTTVTYLLKHLLETVNLSTGLIGTVEYVIGEKKCEADRTTPDVISNHKMLKEMVNAGCKAAAIEVTSHGLMQGRVDEVDFDVAVFTNLTHDHLDYHKTFEAYAEAKKRLFTGLGSSKTAIVYKESPWSKKMVENCSAPLLTYGFTKEADLYAHDILLSKEGTEFKVTYQAETVPFSWSPIGRHNILNGLAALSVMVTRGYSLKEFQTPMTNFKAAPGRLERVDNSSVFVDYAHTPDALENVLNAMKEFKKGKIITVFGCGGDRDQKKRPVMASIAEKLSDVTIVTTDNPRNEDPKNIIGDIVKGFTNSSYLVEIDRRQAIKRAIDLAKEEDLILIAGKGHETYQLFSHQRVFFDDREVAREFLK